MTTLDKTRRRRALAIAIALIALRIGVAIAALCFAWSGADRFHRGAGSLLVGLLLWLELARYRPKRPDPEA